MDDWDVPDSRMTDLLEHGGGGNTTGDEDENSMLKVICSQRDRFRQRLRETEEVSASCPFQNLKILPGIFRSRYRELLTTVQVFFRLEVWRSKALIMKMTKHPRKLLSYHSG
jgi:hypothetical protein